MNRTKKSFLIAFTSVINNLSNSFLGLILTSLMIKIYGADFSGLTSTASQFISMLLIIEGGFTTAVNVALIKPYAIHDVDKIAGIHLAAKEKFKKIGMIFLVVGVISSGLYAIFIKTKYSYWFVLSVLLLSIIPSFYNIFSGLKWKVLFQMEQEDYKINLVAAITTLASYFINIIIVVNKVLPIVTRIIIAIFSVLNIVIVNIMGSKRYKQYLRKEDVHPQTINGVNDVFIINLTGLIYSTFPILFMTVTVGTEFASVYAIYNSIFMILRGLISSILRAPVVGIGQIIHEDKKKAISIFNLYQFSSFFLVTFFVTTAFSLSMPFINLLTMGNNDINYLDYIILVLFSLTFIFEGIHIPSGQMLVISEEYTLCRRIQITALVTIVIGSVIGNQIFGFYGIMAAIFMAAVVLCLLEVYYNYKRIIRTNIIHYLKLCLVSALIMAISVGVGAMMHMEVSNYFTLIRKGVFYSIINALVTVVVYFIFYKDEMNNIIKRLFGIIKK